MNPDFLCLVYLMISDQKTHLYLGAANATADDGLGIGSTAWVCTKQMEENKKRPRVRENISTDADIATGRPCVESSDPQTETQTAELLSDALSY